MRRWLVIGMLAIAGCGEEPYSEENVSLEDGKWQQDEVVTVEVDIADANSEYEISVNIRNTKDYEYRNLWVFMELEGPDAKKIIDTLEFEIADEKGVWTGDASGTLVMNSFVTYEKFKFPQKGKYKFRFRHGMYDAALENVTDVGVKVEEL